MSGIGNPISAITGGTSPLGAVTGGALSQFIEKCTTCLKCLKDKLCECCAGGLKDGDDKCRAAEEQGDKAWQDALAFMQGQGTGFKMALGADA